MSDQPLPPNLPAPPADQSPSQAANGEPRRRDVRRADRASRRAEKETQAAVAKKAHDQKIATALAAGQWWAGLTKSTVAVNVRYMNVKTPTKSMNMGTLKVNPDEGLTWRSNIGPKVRIPWPTIDSIVIDGEATSRLTLTRVATLGVFALGAKKKRTDTQMVVVAKDKEYLFEFEKTQPTVVRNKLLPVLNALTAARSAQAEPPQPAVAQVASSIPSQIAELAQLRDQGILSDAEFELKKAELLDRM